MNETQINNRAMKLWCNIHNRGVRVDSIYPWTVGVGTPGAHKACHFDCALAHSFTKHDFFLGVVF